MRSRTKAAKKLEELDRIEQALFLSDECFDVKEPSYPGKTKVQNIGLNVTLRELSLASCILSEVLDLQERLHPMVLLLFDYVCERTGVENIMQERCQTKKGQSSCWHAL